MKSKGTFLRPRPSIGSLDLGTWSRTRENHSAKKPQVKEVDLRERTYGTMRLCRYGTSKCCCWSSTSLIPSWVIHSRVRARKSGATTPSYERGGCRYITKHGCGSGWTRRYGMSRSDKRLVNPQRSEATRNRRWIQVSALGGWPSLLPFLFPPLSAVKNTEGSFSLEAKRGGWVNGIRSITRRQKKVPLRKRREYFPSHYIWYYPPFSRDNGKWVMYGILLRVFTSVQEMWWNRVPGDSFQFVPKWRERVEGRIWMDHWRQLVQRNNSSALFGISSTMKVGITSN